MPDSSISLTILPGEALATKMVELIIELVKGMDPAAKKEVSLLFVQDFKEWREFWKHVVK
jgi:hypothetical protein